MRVIVREAWMDEQMLGCTQKWGRRNVLECELSSLSTNVFYSLIHHSVVSDSLQPHGLEPTRLLCPWDSPGKSTGVQVAISFSRAYSQPRDGACLSCIVGEFFTPEPTGKPFWAIASPSVQLLAAGLDQKVPLGSALLGFEESPTPCSPPLPPPFDAQRGQEERRLHGSQNPTGQHLPPEAARPGYSGPASLPQPPSLLLSQAFTKTPKEPVLLRILEISSNRGSWSIN